MFPICAVVVASVLAAEPAALTPLAHVETRGDGPVPLVLAPGLCCDWTVWDSFMDRNKDRYTMYAVTLPGFGGTEPPPTPDTNAGTPWLDNAAAAVVDLINDRKLEKPVIVGHSLGGFLALRIATEQPDLIRGAVAVDGMPAFPMGPEPMSPEQRAQMVDQFAPSFLNVKDEEWFAQQDQYIEMWTDDPERLASYRTLFRKTPARVAARYMIELFRSDITAQLGEGAAPMKAIAAVNDDGKAMGVTTEVMRANWEAAMANAPAGSVVYLEDTQHFIMDERPEQLDEIVAEFVKSNP